MAARNMYGSLFLVAVAVMFTPNTQKFAEPSPADIGMRSIQRGANR